MISHGIKCYLNGVADAAANGTTFTLTAADTTNPVGFGGCGGNPTFTSYVGSVNVFLLYNTFFR